MNKESEEFTVDLDVFSGPFEVLLSLITRKKLDITEVSLGQVTDEFIAYMKSDERKWDVDTRSSFLVVAATLLDVKTARLLPGGEVDDPDDIASLEARDLLFARLLQYRAFAHLAGLLKHRWEEQSAIVARPGGLEGKFEKYLPDVVLPGGAARLVKLFGDVMAPRPAQAISLTHLHSSTVNVQAQARWVAMALKHAGTMTFRALTAGVDLPHVVARFLALLQLYRENAVSFEQVTALGELTIRWTGEGDVGEVSDEFDTVPKEG